MKIVCSQGTVNVYKGYVTGADLYNPANNVQNVSVNTASIGMTAIGVMDIEQTNSKRKELTLAVMKVLVFSRSAKGDHMETVMNRDLELGKYLSAKQFQPHEWAVNDCNTFIVEWIDQTYGTDFEGLLQFDYSSALGAARYHKMLPFTAEEFMYMAGFDKTHLPAMNGDVILQNLGPFGFVRGWY